MAGRSTPPKAEGPAPGSSCSEIAPGVFVGGWPDAVGFRGTRLCVMDDPPEEGLPAEAHLPIYDPETGRPIRANLDRISGMVEAARRGHAPVLLFCGHGIRRGPLAGAWYLHRHEGIPLDEAYARIRAVRPRIEHVQQWVRDSQPLFGRDPPRDPVGTGGAGRRSP